MEQQAFWQGIEQFNGGEYYDCHDTLEALWMEAIEPDKTFYQGILQIAVALYHQGNGNQRGAMILLGEGMNRLRRYLPDYNDVDVTSLITESENLLHRLQQETLQSSDSSSNRPSLTGTAVPVIRRLMRQNETSVDDLSSGNLSA